MTCKKKKTYNQTTATWKAAMTHTEWAKTCPCAQQDKQQYYHLKTLVDRHTVHPPTPADSQEWQQHNCLQILLERWSVHIILQILLYDSSATALRYFLKDTLPISSWRYCCTIEVALLPQDTSWKNLERRTVHTILQILLYDSSSTTASKHFLKDTMSTLSCRMVAAALLPQDVLWETLSTSQVKGYLVNWQYWTWDEIPAWAVTLSPLLSQGSGHTPSLFSASVLQILLYLAMPNISEKLLVDRLSFVGAQRTKSLSQTTQTVWFQNLAL